MTSQIEPPKDVRCVCHRNQQRLQSARFLAHEYANGFIPDAIPLPPPDVYHEIDVSNPEPIKMDDSAFTVVGEQDISASVIKQLAKEAKWYRKFDTAYVCSYGNDIVSRIYGMINIIDNY